MSDPTKVLVTGASGFIGGRIVEVFHLAGVFSVRAGIRRWSTCARIGRFPVEIVQCDLLQLHQVRQALQGVSLVVHCAKGSPDETLVGSSNLMAECLRHGVKKFVHLSTAEVYGEVDGEIDETFPLRSTGTEYCDTKIEEENLCCQFRERGLPIVVLRPTIVYGPFSRNWTISIAERLLQGVWGKFARFGQGTCNLLYVDDLIRAAYLALTNASVHGEAFNITGPEVITWNEYFARFNEKLGLSDLREIRILKSTLKTAVMVPVRTLGRYMRQHYTPILKKIASTFRPADLLMRATENAIKTTPAPAELRLFSRNAHYSIEKARRTLGYHPKVDIDTGLTLSVEWLRHHGFLR